MELYSMCFCAPKNCDIKTDRVNDNSTTTSLTLGLAMTGRKNRSVETSLKHHVTNLPYPLPRPSAQSSISGYSSYTPSAESLAFLLSRLPRKPNACTRKSLQLRARSLHNTQAAQHPGPRFPRLETRRTGTTPRPTCCNPFIKKEKSQFDISRSKFESSAFVRHRRTSDGARAPAAQ